MDLRLGPEDDMLRRGAAALLAAEAGPERLASWEAGDAGFSSEMWARLVDLGWPGVAFRADVGGGGGTLLSLGVLAGEIGRAAFASPFLATVGAGLVASRLGLTKRGSALLEAICRDGTQAALIWPADGRSRMFATPMGDRLRLDGGPVLVEWAQVAEALVCLVPVTGSGGRAAAVAVDARAPGIEVSARRSFDNERVAAVHFHGVEVGTAEYLTADLVDPMAAAEALGALRLLRAAEMVGGAERVLELTVNHVASRVQFGAPLGKLQAVQHLCADLATIVAAARLATYEGLSLGTGANCRRSGALAGWLAGQAYVQAAVTGAQLHGGIGAIREYPLHFYYRRAKASQLRLGAAAAQLEELAATLIDPLTGGEPPRPWL